MTVMMITMILQANKVRAARADLQEAVDDDDVPWLYTAASTNHVRQSHFQPQARVDNSGCLDVSASETSYEDM